MLDGVEDAGEAILHGDDVARGKLQIVALAGIHQGGRVRQELVARHQIVELRGDLLRRLPGALCPGRLRGRDRPRHAPAQFIRRLDHLAARVAQ